MYVLLKVDLGDLTLWFGCFIFSLNRPSQTDQMIIPAETAGTFKRGTEDCWLKEIFTEGRAGLKDQQRWWRSPWKLLPLPGGEGTRRSRAVSHPTEAVLKQGYAAGNHLEGGRERRSKGPPSWKIFLLFCLFLPLAKPKCNSDSKNREGHSAVWRVGLGQVENIRHKEIKNTFF